MAVQERVALAPFILRQAGERQDRGHQVEMGTDRVRPRRAGVARIGAPTIGAETDHDVTDRLELLSAIGCRV